MSENIINIDGSEYQFESLKDEAPICIAHVTQLQNEIDMLQMKLVQLNVAKDSFMKTLSHRFQKKSLKRNLKKKKQRLLVNKWH